MIAVMVGSFVLLVLVLVLIWLRSPIFRRWIERPKFQMLERDALYERAAGDSLRQIRKGKQQ